MARFSSPEPVFRAEFGAHNGAVSKLGDGVFELSFDGGDAQVMSTCIRILRENMALVPPGRR